MPKNYGTALYGKGNYSALTASNVTAAQGSFTETGEATLFPLAAKIAPAFGVYALTGFAVGLGKIAWSITAGLFAIAGQTVSFITANLWMPDADVSTSWSDHPPASDPWSPVTNGSATWKPN